MNIVGAQRVYNQHYQLNTSLRQSMLFLGVMIPRVEMCIY